MPAPRVSRINGSAAVLTFEGAWFDQIGDDPKPTGYAGRETRVDGPATVQIDTCRSDLGGPTQPPITVARGDFLYINNDCGQERAFRDNCAYSDEDSAKFMTGIAGAETQMFWIVGTAPPPPNMRIDDTAKDGVVVYWDNFSETQPDVKSLAFDFEGYRVFRADNWDRPTGTNAANGPPADLWKLLFQADIVDGLGDDTGLNQYRYEPLTKTLPAGRKRDMIETMKSYMDEHPRTRRRRARKAYLKKCATRSSIWPPSKWATWTTAANTIATSTARFTAAAPTSMG